MASSRRSMRRRFCPIVRVGHLGLGGRAGRRAMRDHSVHAGSLDGSKPVPASERRPASCRCAHPWALSKPAPDGGRGPAPRGDLRTEPRRHAPPRGPDLRRILRFAVLHRRYFEASTALWISAGTLRVSPLTTGLTVSSPCSRIMACPCGPKRNATSAVAPAAWGESRSTVTL
jgi:hypothetical protein